MVVHRGFLMEKKAKKLAEDLELIKAGGVTVEKVEQLLNDADWPVISHPCNIQVGGEGNRWGGGGEKAKLIVKILKMYVSTQNKSVPTLQQL